MVTKTLQHKITSDYWYLLIVDINNRLFLFEYQSILPAQQSYPEWHEIRETRPTEVEGWSNVGGGEYTDYFLVSLFLMKVIVSEWMVSLRHLNPVLWIEKRDNNNEIYKHLGLKQELFICIGRGDNYWVVAKGKGGFNNTTTMRNLVVRDLRLPISDLCMSWRYWESVLWSI